ncbi:hypothetical protein G4B88_029981 [Cannabis sativa]|uniref:Uncharacterized protein n=1 Tax=Cannabis sativa TaxID=3483 RepID=A0A7J6GCW1_CANSA|nr:hypothetical protein G4B88_029981 [Cannabis sativa]
MELSYTLMGTQATIIVDLPKESKALVSVEYGMCVLLNYVPSLNDMRFLGESGSNSETKQIDTTNNRMGHHTLAKFLGTTTSNLLSASTKPWNTLAIFTWLRRNPRSFSTP